MSITQKFFELLQIAIGTREQFTEMPSRADWVLLLNLARKQTLVSVTFHALQKLHKEGQEVEIDETTFVDWYGNYAETLRRRNELEGVCADLSKMLQNNGFDSCILKGQGMQQFYPAFLSRQSGDIDCWTLPHGGEHLSLKKRRKIVYTFVERLQGKTHVVYHNSPLHIGKYEVEIHYTPSWFFSPMHNARLQRFFEQQWKKRKRTEQGYCIPSIEMNVVYILQHIYRHLFGEGIGLRQCLDYYYVLKEANLKEDDKQKLQETLQSLGMLRFAGAVMYVLQSVFRLDAEDAICEVNEREGRFLLREMLIAGNFGKYDPRIRRDRRKTNFKRFIGHVGRNFHFLAHYPSEVLWTPLWKIRHFCWRKINGYL